MFDWNQAQGELYIGRGCSGSVWRPLPGLVVTRLTGRADVQAVHFYMERARCSMRDGIPLTVFHDWWELDGYDPAARETLSAFGSSDRHRFAHAHYLVRSTVVAIAISTAAFALRRRLSAYRDRDAFLAELQAAIESARKSPGRSRPASSFLL